MAICDILIVDDDETIRNVLMSLFRDEGYRVQTADNGRQALEVLNHVDCAVLLTDLMMPIMDGRELARILRGQESEIPVVGLTVVGGVCLLGLGWRAAASVGDARGCESLCS